MSYTRTPEHRRLRAELIRKWRPWESSTGPKTDAGKASSATNSFKHGATSVEFRESVRTIRRSLSRQIQVKAAG